MARKKKSCGTCKAKLAYSEEFLAKYCEYCNAWLQGKCGAVDCNCADRPDKPLESPLRHEVRK